MRLWHVVSSVCVSVPSSVCYGCIVANLYVLWENSLHVLLAVCLKPRHAHFVNDLVQGQH